MRAINVGEAASTRENCNRPRDPFYFKGARVVSRALVLDPHSSPS